MDKNRIRRVIQLFFLQGKTAKKIHERLAPTLGDLSPSNKNRKTLAEGTQATQDKRQWSITSWNRKISCDARKH